MGTTEAIYESVPILFMPMGGDQITNAKAVMEKEAAIMLEFENVNEEDIFTKIESMLTNPM